MLDDTEDFIDEYLQGSQDIFGQAVEELLFLVFRYPDQLPRIPGSSARLSRSRFWYSCIQVNFR